ncbi:MAG: phosphoglycerate kinase [Bacilli bacterium]|nr:phosphoglycerate kinase [Bacilli bacterium]MDD4809275.1 phosphoglycerate kinase [Bacilli bacterium]
MKKTIRDFDLKDKKVIIRVDFNVPIKDGLITDDNRVVESLETINYAINNSAKVILMSHLGRVKEESDKAKNTLKLVSLRLSELLNKEVIFIPQTRGIELEKAISNLKSGDVLLMENTRYEDLDGEKESNNDLELAKYWANLGDIYINDAFGTSHRSHASNVGLASLLPNGVGFLIEKELKVLASSIDNPIRPLTVILGGAKVSDKIGVIKNLVNKADYILIGGGMAFTFLKAQGIEVGKSLVDLDNLDFCREMLEKHEDKLILPIDVIASHEMSDNSDYRETFITDLKSDEMGLDIGSQTIKVFKQYLVDSQTIIWNGPVGAFEYSNFANGTKALCEILANLEAITILGGGDTASAAINFGYKEAFTHISTGGGASLELLEGKTLSGIDIIHNK